MTNKIKTVETTTTTERYIYDGMIFTSKSEYLDYVKGLRN